MHTYIHTHTHAYTGATGVLGELFGSSHGWGPSDSAGKIKHKSAPNHAHASKSRRSPVGKNSIWSSAAGFLSPTDNADKKLTKLGLNVDGGLQSWI